MEDPLPATRPPKEMAKDLQRIAKLLARAGIASRREVERMIAEGRVALGGKAIDTPATLLASLHGVTVDGRPVKAPAPARLFLYHKPTGALTAERDPQGRPTIYDRMPKGLPRLMPVGRLDLNTEGLLLLTTDGGLKRQLELPSSGVERVYRARTFGEISQEQLETLIEGIEIDGIRYGPIDANLERRTGRNQWIEVRITEGKNREVRRVLEHLGLQVSRLIRIAYGPFELGELPAGEVEEIRQHDLVQFRKALAGGNREALAAATERPRPAPVRARVRPPKAESGERQEGPKPERARETRRQPRGRDSERGEAHLASRRQRTGRWETERRQDEPPSPSERDGERRERQGAKAKKPTVRPKAVRNREERRPIDGRDGAPRERSGTHAERPKRPGGRPSRPARPGGSRPKRGR